MIAPVYRAGETPIEGINEQTLVSGLKAAGHRDASAIAGPQDIAPRVAAIAEPGDFVVFLGAGDITKWAYDLPKELAALDKTSGKKA